MAQRQPLLKLSSVDPEEQHQDIGQQQHHQHQLARRPAGGSGTILLAEIQELSRENLAVVYTLQLPKDSEPAASNTAQVRQVWSLRTQTGCYIHCEVLGNWCCWE